MNEEDHEPVEVPFRELSADALRGLAEAFVLREGTDYGERSYSLSDKIAHVLTQLESGDATIVFDPRSNNVDIVLKRRLAGG